MTWTLPGAILFLLGLLLLLGYFLSRKVFPGGSEDDESSAPHGPDCDGCGQAGCGGFAKALIRGGQDEEFGPSGETSAGTSPGCASCESPGLHHDVKAFIRCRGIRSAIRYHYSGAQSCKAAASMQPRPKLCAEACLGFGDCCESCSARAIRLVTGIARIDPARCTGCGDCIPACPPGLIELMPAGNGLGVACQRPQEGEGNDESCPDGCNSCAVCVEACPQGAILLTGEGLPDCKQDQCDGCGECVKACPREILFLHSQQ